MNYALCGEDQNWASTSITKKEERKLYLKKKIEQDQGKERAEIKIMYLFLKLTIHKVPLN